MDSRLLATIIIFPVWLTIVLLFRRQRQWLLYYLAAAFGLTIQLVFLAEHFGWDQWVVNFASFQVNLISKYLFHLPIELMSSGRLQLALSDGTNSILKLGIECSAVLESSIAVSLILFYPLFNFPQKIVRALFALVVTYAINIIRLMIIVLMAHKFGPDYIFLAHAGVARIFFFGCELLLYWYLMTKPTVKSVGVSIEKGIPLSLARSVGHALQLRNAFTQIAVIVIVIGASVGGFIASDEWKKAFGPVAKQDRPIIYQDETELITNPEDVANQLSDAGVKGAATSGIDQEITLNLAGGEKSVQKFDVTQEEEINVQVLKGQQGLASRIVVNGKSVELVTMAPWLFGRVESVFKPLTVKPGDVLEIKFQNLSDKPSQYFIKIFPTPPPETVSDLSGEPPKSVAGLATTDGDLYQKIVLDLLPEAKSPVRFKVKQAGQFNVQVLEGQQDLACRLTLNGENIGFVSMAPWRFSKYTSIFEPFKVRPGDVLELNFQNLSADKSAHYVVKIYPSKVANE